MSAYEDAKLAIANGTAEAFALWVLLADEHDRDGYALKPMPWEGSGEYQHITFVDGRDGFVKIPLGQRSLPVPKTERRSAVERPDYQELLESGGLSAKTGLGPAVRLMWGKGVVATFVDEASFCSLMGGFKSVAAFNDDQSRRAANKSSHCAA
jgi:hypothetical protein